MNDLFTCANSGKVASFILLLTAAITANAEGLTLNQCANGGIADAVDHEQCYEGWINGNLNKTKAAYAEGEFVPYRVQLTGLTIGAEYTYSFSWDILKSGQHAMDYIGSYDHTVSGADACLGLAEALCTGTNSIFAIPGDGDLPFSQTTGNINLFGGTITWVGPYTYPNAPAVDVRATSVTFTASQSTAILTWGGHISSPFDWGEGTTASNINGSPYHFSNISLQDSTGRVVASGGQDVQLSAAAVFVPSTITVTKTANKDGSFSFDSFFDDTIPMPPDGESNSWNLARGGSKSLTALDEGKVEISEVLLPAGAWRLKSINCSKLNDGVVFSYDADTDDETNTAVFDVDEGGTFSCTFDNEFFGAPVLAVIKKVIAPTGTCTTDVRDSAGFETRSIHSGEQVKYCYWVTNTGSDPALDISMMDDRGGLAADTAITLTGGSDLDGDADLPDLANGEYVSGELVVAIDAALNSTITNIATATGTGQFDGQTYTKTDTAQVTVDQASTCSLVASVYTGTGPCPGAPQVNVLAGTPVNWCAKATWDSGAAVKLTNISVALLTTAESNTGADMIPGASQDILVGSTSEATNFVGTLKLTGSEGGFNPVNCQSQAVVNVVTPGLMLTKTISRDALCDAGDTNTLTIISGESVWYCLKVENTGDVPLTNTVLDDGDISVSGFDAGSFDAGQIKTFPFGPFEPSSGYTNIAMANASVPITKTTVGPVYSSATLTVLSADVAVDKSVDLRNIVICDDANPPVDPQFCTEDDGYGLFDTSYTIIVSNNGPNVATGVSLSDTLPTGFLYDSHDATGAVICDDTHLPAFDCDIGYMEPSTSVTITVVGKIDPEAFDFPWTIVTNQACANTDPVRLDPNLSNNCDDAKTRLGTGATRTIGWWSTHPDGLNKCLDDSGGTINLGFLTIQNEGTDNTIDATVSTDASEKGKFKSSLMTAIVIDDDDGKASTAIEMAKGMMNANVAHWGDGIKRSHIGQARVKAAKQLTGAWCNETLFGSSFGNFLGGWNAIYLIMGGKAYMDGDTLINCGGECPKQDLNRVIQSINLIGGAADLFNNSGDDLEIPFPPGPADPKAPENDPTDPAE